MATPKFRLGRAHPHPRLNIDIIINPIYVCIGMMNDIMFYIPHKGTATEKIQGKGGNIVNPFVFTETSMGAIVHDVKAYPGGKIWNQHFLSRL